MHTENANAQHAFDLAQSPDLLTSITTALLPALSAVVNNAVNRAVIFNTSPTMSKDDFAMINGISKSLLEKWIRDGVVSTERMTQSRKNAFVDSVHSGIRCLTLAAMAVHARIHCNPTMCSTLDAVSGIGASIGLS